MTTKELYRHLLAFNEDEKFYESYYDAHKKQWKLEEFLKSLDYQEVLDRRLIITEVDTGYMPSSMSDETYFSPDNKNSIILSKHNRYAPAFRHKHVFFELAYVLCGSCTQKINQDEITLTEGQFCLLAPHVSHSISVFDSSLVLNILIRRGTFENLFYNMLYDGNKISLFFNQSLFSNTGNSYLILDTDRDKSLREHVLTMFLEYTEKKNYYENILNSQLMILFAKILQNYEERIQYPLMTRKGNLVCMELIQYMEEHFDSVTLKELAETFHFSQGHCSRLIKAYTGKSFTQIIQSLRFQKARTLLTTTDISVVEISHMAGFENPEHFNRLFKKHFGTTPGKYRHTENHS